MSRLLLFRLDLAVMVRPCASCGISMLFRDMLRGGTRGDEIYAAKCSFKLAPPITSSFLAWPLPLLPWLGDLCMPKPAACDVLRRNWLRGESSLRFADERRTCSS